MSIEFLNNLEYIEIGEITLSEVGDCKVIILKNIDRLKFEIVAINDNFNTSLSLIEPKYDYSTNYDLYVSKLSNAQLITVIKYLTALVHKDEIKYFTYKESPTMFDLLIEKIIDIGDNRSEYLKSIIKLNKDFSIPSYIRLTRYNYLEYEDYLEKYYETDSEVSKFNLESVIEDMFTMKRDYINKKLYSLYSSLACINDIDKDYKYEQDRLYGKLQEVVSDLYNYITSYTEKTWIYKMYPDMDKYIARLSKEFGIDMSIYELVVEDGYKKIINLL